MAIANKPKIQSASSRAAADAFISRAPDAVNAGAAKPMPRRDIKTVGNKAVITVTINPTLLAQLDAWANARGMSRAAAISYAVGSLDL